MLLRLLLWLLWLLLMLLLMLLLLRKAGRCLGLRSSLLRRLKLALLRLYGARRSAMG